MTEKSDLSGKKILILEQGLLQQDFYDFLENIGMTVHHIDIEHIQPYQYSSVKDKFLNITNRIFFKDKNYLQELEYQYLNKNYRKKIKFFRKGSKIFYDFILIIRPDNFSAETIKLLSSFGKEISGYMWDGLSPLKTERLLKNRKFFKNLFIFNFDDLAIHPELKMKFITNFYYPNEKRLKISKKNSNKITYIGNSTQDRRDIYLSEIHQKYIDNQLFKPNYILHKPNAPEETLVKNGVIQYIGKKISYTEYLDDLATSFATFDLKLSTHNGVSFRIFESLYYQKKVITTNPVIKYFDFYDENNILIIEKDEDLKKINYFLKTPYQPVPEEILNKYRIDNWLKNVFEIGSFIKIEYPDSAKN